VLIGPTWVGKAVIEKVAHNKQTTKKTASKAAKVLANPRSTKAEKSAAASALAQYHPSRKGRKK
jgi:hypothetical protein